MAKYILEQAGNIDWMALFALITFFGIFTLSLILIFFGNKQQYQRLAELPLELEEAEPNLEP